MNSNYPLDFDIGVAQGESYGAIPDIPQIFSRREGGTQEATSFDVSKISFDW